MRERTRLDAVTHPTLKSPTIVLAEHRNWTLQAHWFHSFRGATEGWVCYVTGPNSSHKLNIGRWPSSDHMAISIAPVSEPGTMPIR